MRLSFDESDRRLLSCVWNASSKFCKGLINDISWWKKRITQSFRIAHRKNTIEERRVGYCKVTIGTFRPDFETLMGNICQHFTDWCGLYKAFLWFLNQCRFRFVWTDNSWCVVHPCTLHYASWNCTSIHHYSWNLLEISRMCRCFAALA